jgi:hypothetical protein
MDIAEFPYKPHKTQLEVHNFRSSMKFLAAGARWGKDMLTSAEIVATALLLPEYRKGEKLIPIAHIWYLAPTYSILRQQWRYLTSFIEQISESVGFNIVKKQNNSLFIIELYNGAVIEGKSADRPLQLKGVGLDLLAITEAALIPDVAWEESLVPRLASPGRLGIVIANSTPRGRRGWFYKMWKMGREKMNDEISGFHYASWDNPMVDPKWIEKMKMLMPEHKFMQEIAASFDVDGGFVFSPYMFLFDVNKESYKPSEHVIAGIDTGGKYDYAALVFLDYNDDKYVLFDYVLEKGDPKEIINKFAKKLIHYKPKEIVIENNFAPLWGEELKRECNKYGWTPKIKSIRTTAKNKGQMIDRILMRMGEGTLHIINDDIIKQHFGAVEIDDSGKYFHPKGTHDDLVMATAIALEGTSKLKLSFV